MYSSSPPAPPNFHPSRLSAKIGPWFFAVAGTFHFYSPRNWGHIFATEPRQRLPEAECRLTRRKRIDPRPAPLGWEIVLFVAGRDLASYSHHAITEYETDAGPADYAFVVDGQLLGICEAKKVTLGPQGVLTQAERYSKGAVATPLNFRGYRVPLLYSTNGEVLWHHDVRHRLHLARRIAEFHTPAAMDEIFCRDLDTACARLAAAPNDHPVTATVPPRRAVRSYP